MGLLGISASLRRRLLAVMVVLMLAAGVGYHLRKTPPIYSDSATVVFRVKKSVMWSNVHTTPAKSLITTEVMITQDLMSPSARHRVSAAGGTARFSLSPFNTYNLQFPNYAEPVATVSATSLSPAAARRTFRLVLGFLRKRLATMQARAGVPPRDRIRTYLVGRAGPVTQRGSPARVFAGLALLTVVAAVMISAFAGGRRDRRRARSARPARWRAQARHAEDHERRPLIRSLAGAGGTRRRSPSAD